MYGYLAYYNGKKTEIYAKTAWEAKLAAIAHFRVRKAQEHMVSVILCERPDGSAVTHATTF